MLQSQFLVGCIGETKSLKTITTYFKGLSNFKRFHQKHKMHFLRSITVVLMKIKTASVHTGVGKHREMKGIIKVLSTMMNFSEMNWQHPKLETLTSAKKNTDEINQGWGWRPKHSPRKGMGLPLPLLICMPFPSPLSPALSLPFLPSPFSATSSRHILE